MEGTYRRQRNPRINNKSMKTKVILLCILCGALAYAGDPFEKALRSMNRGDFTFSYIRINRKDKTEWELRQVPSAEIILRLTHDKTNADSSIYTYSNLIDVMRESNKVGVLLSLDVGLLYIQCNRAADGSWSEAWRQIILGATGPSKNTASIRLDGINSVEIASSEGVRSTYTITNSQVKKDGVPYSPSKIFSISGGNSQETK
jgi:hypothetical protein